jgi:hypothetical protein
MSPVISGWNDVAMQVALPHRDDPTRAGPASTFARTCTCGADLLDPGRADEHRPDRLAVDTHEGEVLLEALDLPPERVPADRHVDAAERLLPRTARPARGRPA